VVINILGCDGCGKTTQVALLKDWALASHWQNVSVPSKKALFDASLYPECAFLGVDYREFSHNYFPSLKGNSRFLFLAFMHSVITDHFPKDYDTLVLLDGYWQKNLATELAMGRDETWMRAVSSFFPTPELTFVIDIDPSEIVDRGHQPTPYETGCDPSLSGYSFIEHQRKVRSALLKLAEEFRYTIVDGRKEILDIFNIISKSVERQLGLFAK
jgi:dTMP kinase